MKYLINLSGRNFLVAMMLLSFFIGSAVFYVPDYMAKPLLVMSSIVVFILYVRDALKKKQAKEIVEDLCSTGRT